MNKVNTKQGRIRGRISRVRLGRGSDAKTIWNTPKKQIRYQPTDRPKVRHRGVQSRVHATKKSLRAEKEKK